LYKLVTVQYLKTVKISSFAPKLGYIEEIPMIFSLNWWRKNAKFQQLFKLKKNNHINIRTLLCGLLTCSVGLGVHRGYFLTLLQIHPTTRNVDNFTTDGCFFK